MSDNNYKAPKTQSEVIDIFTGKSWNVKSPTKYIRLTPEIDGIEMLYTNDVNPEKLFSMKILCWALTENGETVALIPWLNKLTPCTELNDPLDGRWEGFYDTNKQSVFYDPPIHKMVELESAASYYKPTGIENHTVQEIPDCIGTHAITTSNSFQTYDLMPVISWRLTENGNIEAMLAKEELIVNTPVLPGDNCLYPANQDKDFKYFFHHNIANKIKSGDPSTVETFSRLTNN